MPKEVQSAVPITDTDKYPKDFAVSGSKQSAGMTLRTVPESGKSSCLKERAFPFNP